MRDIILVACIKCKSYSIKTVGEDALCSYYISTIISKIRQKYLDHQKKNKRVANIVPNTCVKFESIPLKTVGGDRF